MAPSASIDSARMAPNIRHRLQALAEQMDRLAEELFGLWARFAPRDEGGVHGFLDRSWNPVVDEECSPKGPSGEVRGDQSLVQQSRHLFAYSLTAARRPDWPKAAELAHHQFEHLQRHFARPGGQPWVSQLSAQNVARPLPVQMYGQGFAVYALSTYARTFGNDAAGQQARWLADTIHELRVEPIQGGYDQRQDGQWLRQVNAPDGAARCTNTVIHQLEAVTALVRAFPADQQVRERLVALQGDISQRMLQPRGYVHQYFDVHWRPVGEARVSYGHDLETSWLLRDALEALLTADSRRAAGEAGVLEEAADRMAHHALHTGWDADEGGFYEYGIAAEHGSSGQVRSRQKVWWVQVEAIAGMYALLRRKGKEPALADMLVDRIERTWDFSQRHLWDAERGGFYWSVGAQGEMGPRGDHKGEMWKTPYHALRALLLTVDWINDDLARHSLETEGRPV